MTGGETFLAVDLGASSGRVIAGRFDGARIALADVHRFPNGPVRAGGRMTTDFEGLWREIARGLAAAGAAPAGIGVDAWGVDYGLLDAQDRLLEPPVHYRDPRTNGMMDRAFRTVPKGEIFRATGIQFMQINTLYQLLARVAADDPALARAHAMLFTPDLVHHRLTGVKIAEYTIASTSQMLDAARRDWARPLLARLGLPTRLLPPVVPPGTVLGEALPDVAAAAGWTTGVPVVAVGAHDTASAVAAVPDLDASSAYLSSGTWSLLGVECAEPVIDDLAFVLNFTNEGGLDGTIRLLKNVMGLWLVQECQREWNRPLEALMASAEAAPPLRHLIDPDGPEFLAPASMPEAIRGYCFRTGQSRPASEGEIVRAALEGLALKYRLVLADLEKLTGRSLATIRVVGGGSRNDLLNRFTADACGRTVVAGPVEATALGNVACQAVALGRLPDLAAARRVIGASVERTTFTPGPAGPWDEAAARLERLIHG